MVSSASGSHCSSAMSTRFSILGALPAHLRGAGPENTVTRRPSSSRLEESELRLVRLSPPVPVCVAPASSRACWHSLAQRITTLIVGQRVLETQLTVFHPLHELLELLERTLEIERFSLACRHVASDAFGAVGSRCREAARRRGPGACPGRSSRGNCAVSLRARGDASSSAADHSRPDHPSR